MPWQTKNPNEQILILIFWGKTMGKKKSRKDRRNTVNTLVPPKRPVVVLPQNFVVMGEPSPEDKKVYISQKTYNDIHAFTNGKTENESGGFLLGHIIEEFGKQNVIVIGFIEAKETEATPTTLTFTHRTWELANAEIEKMYTDEKIVGWIHTHPSFGIFLSEYDTFIQKNTFNMDFQIAMVVDPVQNIEGLYCWKGDEIVKCKGFYIFEETDIEITLLDDQQPAKNESAKNNLLVFNIFTVVLLVAVIAIGVLFTMQSKEITTIKSQIDVINNNIEKIANAHNALSQQVTENEQLEQSIGTQIEELESSIADLQIQLIELETEVEVKNNSSRENTQEESQPPLLTEKTELTE